MTYRLPEVDPQDLSPSARKMFHSAETRFGDNSTVIRILANSPAALVGYLALDNALSNGHLDPGVRQQIALSVAEVNGCRQCVQEHAAAGKALGLDEITIKAARHASSTDPRIEAALQFARKVAEYRGDITDDEFDRMRRAGYSSEEIAEIIANVVLTIYANYFTSTAQLP
jgi:uncharacterized peroxidase-related enzyme